MQVLESINKFYSSENIVRFYSENSLFPEEKVIFERYLKETGTVLDLCCGAGRATFPLAEKGFQVTGVDINKKLIAAAREKALNYPDTTFILSDAETAELPENNFDYILLLHNSLEFVPTKKKRERIFKKLNKCLKKDGLLISTFHSAYYPFHVLTKLIASNIKNINNPDMEYNDFFYKKDDLFYHVFTPLEILSSFNRSNFKVHAVHGSHELLAEDKSIKKSFLKLLIPFDYTYWVFKKK